MATVYGAAPLIVLALSRVLLGDPLTLPRIAGLASGFLGITILSFGKPSPDFSLFGVVAPSVASGFSLWTVREAIRGISYATLPVTALCCAFGVCS